MASVSKNFVKSSILSVICDVVLGKSAVVMAAVEEALFLLELVGTAVTGAPFIVGLFVGVDISKRDVRGDEAGKVELAGGAEGAEEKKSR